MKISILEIIFYQILYFVLLENFILILFIFLIIKHL